jgi:hypothetical protein
MLAALFHFISIIVKLVSMVARAVFLLKAFLGNRIENVAISTFASRLAKNTWLRFKNGVFVLRKYCIQINCTFFQENPLTWHVFGWSD